MASDFPMFLASGVDEGLVVPYTPETGETFKTGALVYYDTSTNTIKKCGADPGSILGVALGAAAASTIYADGKIPVMVLNPSMLFGFASSVAPAESRVGDTYGLVESSAGNWLLDTTETGSPLVVVVKVDIPNCIFYARFLAAYLQLDAIAS